MSLCIASLAFEHTSTSGDVDGDRLGILIGSGLSGAAGYLLLRSLRPFRPHD